ncbi:MAG: hypothetical protein WD768_18820 [Phycisphaeraceae bacterium]
MLDKVTRISAITLIALMIWLYAEGATRKQYTVTLTVNFVPPPNLNLLIEPSSMPVVMTVRCATSQLQQVKNLSLTPLNIEVTTAEQMQDVKELIGSLGEVNSLGITIERVDPSSITSAKVEKLQTRELRIELEPPPGTELAGQPTLSHEMIKVTLPASFASQLEDFKMRVKIESPSLAGVVPGVPVDRKLRVTLPAAMANWPNVTFSPEDVNVTFAIKKKEDEFTVSLVPVFLSISPTLARQYDVEIDPESLSLRDVKLKGPSDVIGKIRAGGAAADGAKVEAVLRLTSEDLEKRIQAKLPELRLPAGVTVDSNLPLIKLTITPRLPN